MKAILTIFTLAAALSGAQAEQASIDEINEAYSDLTPLCMMGESDEGGKVSSAESLKACRGLVYVISAYNGHGICIRADLVPVPCPQPNRSC